MTQKSALYRWYKKITLPFEVGHLFYAKNWVWGKAVEREDLTKIKELMELGIVPSKHPSNHYFLSNLVAKSLIGFNSVVFDEILKLKIPTSCFHTHLKHYSRFETDTLLHYACYHSEKFPYLEKMLNYGVQHHGDIYTENPLLFSLLKAHVQYFTPQENLSKNNNSCFLAWKMVGKLVEQYPDLERYDFDGSSLFSFAQSPARIRWLIKKGVDFNEKIQHQLIVEWVENNQWDLLHWIHRYRGNLSPLNKEGQTPFQVLAVRYQQFVQPLFKSGLLYLIEHDLDLLNQDNQGQNFMHLIAHLTQIRSAGSEPDFLNAIPKSILKQACQMKNHDGRTPVNLLKIAQRVLKKNPVAWVDHFLLDLTLKQVSSSPKKQRL